MDQNSDRIAIIGGDILTPQTRYQGGTILIEQGRILDVGAEDIAIPEGFQILDASGFWLAPGLIDGHTHGLLGFDNFGPDLVHSIPRYPEYGVSSFLATTMSAPLEVTIRNLEAMAQILSDPPLGARCLGIHLEGPYLSAQQAGAAIPAALRPFDWDEFQQLQRAAGGWIKRITLAPELLPRLGVIEQLQAQSVQVSAGHTNANFEQMEAAVKAGLRQASHVYNAMRNFHHRDPGPLPALLLADSVNAEVIADGQHVASAALELLLKIKGVDRVLLVSDSAPQAGLPPGQYSWGGRRVHVRRDRCQLEDGTLAGAYLGLDQGVRTMTTELQLALGQALQMASSNPAQTLALASVGRLAAGMQADICWFDRSLKPYLTMVAGKTVWRKSSTNQ